jgi:hypothetical protein
VSSEILLECWPAFSAAAGRWNHYRGRPVPGHRLWLVASFSRGSWDEFTGLHDGRSGTCNCARSRWANRYRCPLRGPSPGTQHTRPNRPLQCLPGAPGATKARLAAAGPNIATPRRAAQAASARTAGMRLSREPNQTRPDGRCRVRPRSRRSAKARPRHPADHSPGGCPRRAASLGGRSRTRNPAIGGRRKIRTATASTLITPEQRLHLGHRAPPTDPGRLHPFPRPDS